MKLKFLKGSYDRIFYVARDEDDDQDNILMFDNDGAFIFRESKRL